MGEEWSCFHSSRECSIVQLESEHNYNTNSSSINLTQQKLPHQQHLKMIGTSSTRFMGSLLPLRSPRFFKNLCFLTAVLTFCVGIGIGALIPLFLMPRTESLMIGNTFHSSIRSPETNNVHQDIFVSSGLEAREQRQMMVRQESATTVSPSMPSSDDDISSRFPEFAQIQALVQHDTKVVNTHSGSDTRTKVIHPNYHVSSLLRPKPNVKFVNSRILALHPIQSQFQQTPQVKLESNRSTEIPTSHGFVGSHTRTKSVPTKSTSSELVEGIYWSAEVEKQLPKGFTNENVTAWRNIVLHAAVNRIEEGCGRMQNRLLTLQGEVQACCRYRQNSDQIQGEIFSFYLSRLLGLENLVPSTLALIQPANSKWTRVSQELSVAQWMEEKPVVFTQFIPNLAPAFIPTPLRNSKRSLHPIDIALLSNSVEPSSASSIDVKELAQWSDLIVFDYLTANLDRMVNNLFNLQWNEKMMDAPAHNLVKDSSTGLLVFLDNESGLLHGYRLLDKYEQYHRLMLDAVCVFRRSTANAITKLHNDKNVGHLLKEMFHSSEPHLIDYLPMMPDKSVTILQSRIELVYNQIKKCESLYAHIV